MTTVQLHLAFDFKYDVALICLTVVCENRHVESEPREVELLRAARGVGVRGQKPRVDGEISIVRTYTGHPSFEIGGRHDEGRIGRRAIERLKLCDAQLLA